MVTVSQNLHPQIHSKNWVLAPTHSVYVRKHSFLLFWVQILLGIALATVIFDKKHENIAKNTPLFWPPPSPIGFQAFLVVFGPGYPQKGGGGGVPPLKKSKKPLFWPIFGGKGVNFTPKSEFWLTLCTKRIRKMEKLLPKFTKNRSLNNKTKKKERNKKLIW